MTAQGWIVVAAVVAAVLTACASAILGATALDLIRKLPRRLQNPWALTAVALVVTAAAAVGTAVLTLDLGGSRTSATSPDTAATGVPPADDAGVRVAPVTAVTRGGGRVDVEWRAIDDPDLDHYEVEVIAVDPISYDYVNPFLLGDRSTNAQLYPASYLNKALGEVGDTRRVSSGQIWHVCVIGVRAASSQTDAMADEIAESRACSADFRSP